MCQKYVKLYFASIGRKQSVRKLNTLVHFEDYQKVISMYILEIILANLWRSLALATPPIQSRTQASERAIIVTS